MTPPITSLRGLAWFWAGLLAAGTAAAGSVQWLGRPEAPLAPVAPPALLEQAAIAHATDTPRPALRPVAVAAKPTVRVARPRLVLAIPVPPMPPRAVPLRRPAPPPRAYVQMRRPPALRPPALRQPAWAPPPPAAYPAPYYQSPYAAPDPHAYAYYPGYGYYGWRY